MTKKVITKVKKKRWLPMFAPPLFSDQLIGESFVVEQEDLMGRKVSVSIANLTKEMRRQAQSVTFQAIQHKGNGVVTAIVGFETALSSCKRLVKKNRTKITDSILIKFKDEKIARVKPFIVARSKVPNSLQTKLRLNARSILAREAQNLTFQKFMEDVITGKIQKLLKVSLQKSHPLAACEMRMVKLERATTPLELGDTQMELPKRKPRTNWKDDKAKVTEKSDAPAETSVEKTKAPEKPAEKAKSAKKPEAEA